MIKRGKNIVDIALNQGQSAVLSPESGANQVHLLDALYLKPPRCIMHGDRHTMNPSKKLIQ